MSGPGNGVSRPQEAYSEAVSSKKKRVVTPNGYRKAPVRPVEAALLRANSPC